MKERYERPKGFIIRWLIDITFYILHLIIRYIKFLSDRISNNRSNPNWIIKSYQIMKLYWHYIDIKLLDYQIMLDYIELYQIISDYIGLYCILYYILILLIITIMMIMISIKNSWYWSWWSWSVSWWSWILNQHDDNLRLWGDSQWSVRLRFLLCLAPIWLSSWWWV